MRDKISKAASCLLLLETVKFSHSLSVFALGDMKVLDNDI